MLPPVVVGQSSLLSVLALTTIGIDDAKMALIISLTFDWYGNIACGYSL